MPSGIYKRSEKEIERLRKISHNGKGKKKPPRSKEHCLNLGKSLKGKRSPNKGKTFSKEWKEKLRTAKIGNKNALGHKKTKKVREKISQGHLGKTFSKETIKKMGEAQTKRWDIVGRKTYKRYIHTTNKQYINWRKSIFERDNYTCQECGLKGVYLEAHHIKSWAKFPKLRYKLENGLTLCRECHKLTDNYTNKKNA